MLFICIYVLNRVPDMVQGMRTAFRQVKAIFVVRGLAGGDLCCCISSLCAVQGFLMVNLNCAA